MSARCELLGCLHIKNLIIVEKAFVEGDKLFQRDAFWNEMPFLKEIPFLDDVHFLDTAIVKELGTTEPHIF